MNTENIMTGAENQAQQFLQTQLGDTSLETANQLFKKYGADKYSSFASWWDEQMKKIQSNGLYNPGMTPLDIVNTNRRIDGLPVINPSDINNTIGAGSLGAFGATNAGSSSGEEQKFTIAGVNGYVVLTGAAILVSTVIYFGIKFLVKKNK